MARLDTSVFVPRQEDLAVALAFATAADAVLLAQQYLRAGDPSGAVAACGAARAAGLSEPAIALSEAAARFGLGSHAEALALADGVLAVVPTHLPALHLKALMLAATGRRQEASVLLRRVIDVFPDYPGALTALSAWTMPGLPYRDVLARLHDRLLPRTYLEVGVESGATLALASRAERAVGVDPAARLTKALPPCARLVAMESDAFFERETKDTAFDGRDVDLTFIDGMHLFEYALRDFAHAERWAAPDGAIVLHDCLAVAEPCARRERVSQFWVGDVWKAVEALLDYRADLRVSVVLTPPSGLVIVRRLDPSSSVLLERMDDLVRRYRDRAYPYTPATWAERYRVFSADDAGIEGALSA